ncbi:hypothetical protein ACFSM5_06595 [Lacibacterium aquatile]|uniref:Uncharacterized protein n=1 Tax=Lacibacterium aquatile TaxID=1168082 RepID=A0ABW5DP66_9PROT
MRIAATLMSLFFVFGGVAAAAERQAVTDADVERVLPSLPKAPIGNRAGISQLKGDFTCDGVSDRIVGYLDSPDEEYSGYWVSFISKSGGKLAVKTIGLGAGHNQIGICGNQENKITLHREDHRKFDVSDWFGDLPVCKVAVRVQDDACDSPRIFWIRSGEHRGELVVGRN